MGDRGNIIVRQGGDLPAVVLYTHWGGTELPSDLRQALAKGVRWNDPAYLARIIFDVMTAGQRDTETGFGISTGLPDNEHPLLDVDCASQTVRIRSAGWGHAAIDGPIVNTFTFEEFVKLGTDFGFPELAPEQEKD